MLPQLVTDGKKLKGTTQKIERVHYHFRYSSARGFYYRSKSNEHDT